MFSGNAKKADLYFEKRQETVLYHSRSLNGGERMTNDDCLPCQHKQFIVKKSQLVVHFEHGGRRRQDGGGQTVRKNI